MGELKKRREGRRQALKAQVGAGTENFSKYVSLTGARHSRGATPQRSRLRAFSATTKAENTKANGAI